MNAVDNKGPFFENGHFYSPVVDTADIRARAAELWPGRDGSLGIDFRKHSQLALLEQTFPKHLPSFNYPSTASDALDEDGRQWFYLDNDHFSNLDAVTLFVLLCELRPRRVIEIGSGFSSLLMADVRRRFFQDRLEIHCIEPFPRPFLRDTAYGLDLIESKVQDVPLSFFEMLEPGDVLFIDSSHVSKTGSDVNYLMFEVVPRLLPGVYVHIHDIFLPNDYPFEWVVKENRSWNEQYVVQAYLMFNHRAKVLFGSAYANTVLAEQTVKALDGKAALYGGSLWFQIC